MVASFDDAQAKLNELTAASAAERAQVADGLARIKDLLNQLANAAAPDLQPLVDQMQTEIDALKADDTTP